MLTPKAPPSTRPPRSELIESIRLLTPSLSRAACGGLPANRRHEVRRALRLGCRVRRLEGLRLVADRAIDLSPEGALVLSDDFLFPGAQLVVSFMATDLPIWFDTRATVARVIEGRRPGDAGRALGLRFNTMPSVSRLILRGHLRKLPPTVPQRQVPRDLTHARDPDYAGLVRAIQSGV
jgi:hypothetical protein